MVASLSNARISKGLLATSGIEVVGVTSRLADLAHEIRSYYPKADGTGSKISTPDAIHLATATAKGCGRFLTFDGLREGKKKPRGLLALKSPLAGKHELQIEAPRRPPPPPEPSPRQASLFDPAQLGGPPAISEPPAPPPQIVGASDPVPAAGESKAAEKPAEQKAADEKPPDPKPT